MNTVLQGVFQVLQDSLHPAASTTSCFSVHSSVNAFDRTKLIRRLPSAIAPLVESKSESSRKHPESEYTAVGCSAKALELMHFTGSSHPHLHLHRSLHSSRLLYHYGQ